MEDAYGVDGRLDIQMNRRMEGEWLDTEGMTFHGMNESMDGGWKGWRDGLMENAWRDGYRI